MSNIVAADAFHRLFPWKPLIGMVHLGALPGSARWAGSLDEVLGRAVADAEALAEGGADGIMVENFFDAPFHKSAVPPVTVAAMTAAALAIRAAVSLPLGVNVLRNDACAALSIAHVCGAQFVRCNVFVGAVVTDQGIIEGAAQELLDLRSRLGSSVQIWADVGVKHAAALGDYPLSEQARDARVRGLADALIVTGAATGAATPFDRVVDVSSAVPGCPVLVGSGVDESSAREMARVADGAIVGSSLKEGGVVANPVSVGRVRSVASAFRGTRNAPSEP
jgi:membrane complex biogenesis BtpA family protein